MTLMAHQLQGVEFLLGRDKAVLLHDRGLGKTAQALVALEQKFNCGDVKAALYVAPLSTLENVVREAERFAPSLRCKALIGTAAQRRRMLADRFTNVFVLNYEGVRVLYEDLAKMPFDAIVADELTRLKGRETQVSLRLKVLAKRCKVRWGLGSMPFSEGVEEAWSQFDFIQPGTLGMNYYEFRNRYCVLKEEKIPLRDKAGQLVFKKYVHVMSDGSREERKELQYRKFSTISGYKNMEEFERRISPLVHRRSKAECLDLPPKTYQILKVELSKDARDRYQAIEDQVASEIKGKVIDHAMAMTKLNKCRQVAAGFIYGADKEVIEFESAKLGELSELVGELYGSKKMVVFTAFRAEPPIITKRLTKDHPLVSVFTLPDNPLNRQKFIDEWSALKGPAVLIANVQSGGTGLNLQAADTSVYFTNDWSYEDRAQSEDRTHRHGQTSSKVLIIDIITSDTVEEDVHEALKTKGNLVDVFLKRLERNRK